MSSKRLWIILVIQKYTRIFVKDYQTSSSHAAISSIRGNFGLFYEKLFQSRQPARPSGVPHASRISHP
jgi:hypothetical protein